VDIHSKLGRLKYNAKMHIHKDINCKFGHMDIQSKPAHQYGELTQTWTQLWDFTAKLGI